MNRETSNVKSGAAVACAWLAVPPFHVNGADFVIDATGSTVLACSEETDCPLRFSEREVGKDGFFTCPNCGRLGQRMIEASPEQCDMTANVRLTDAGPKTPGLRGRSHTKNGCKKPEETKKS